VQGGLQTAQMQLAIRGGASLRGSLASLIDANGPDSKADASTESSPPFLQRGAEVAAPSGGRCGIPHAMDGPAQYVATPVQARSRSLSPYSSQFEVNL
jgi:hypothetical protein